MEKAAALDFVKQSTVRPIKTYSVMALPQDLQSGSDVRRVERIPNRTTRGMIFTRTAELRTILVHGKLNRKARK